MIGPSSFFFSLGPLDVSEASLTTAPLLTTWVPEGIQQVQGGHGSSSTCRLVNISFWRCGSRGSLACLCLTNHEDNGSEGAGQDNQESGHVSDHHLFGELVIPHLWKAGSLHELVLGPQPPKSWSKAKLSDRWRECFETTLLSLISADRKPPSPPQGAWSDLSLAKLRYFSEVAGLETFSLCTDWSGNLERISFLLT